MSIGDALAAARREAGLTITQVSQRTCIRETIVRGIERGDYSACGGDFYARGHIRSIARAVALDPEELVREYDATEASPQPITAADVFQPYTPVRLRERRRPNWSVVLLAGLVAVLGIAGFRYFGGHKATPPSRPAAAAQHHQPPHAKTSPAALTHTVPLHPELTLVVAPGGLVWAQLTSATGQFLLPGRDLYGPTRLTWRPKHTVYLRLGNPGVTTVLLNGKKQALHAVNPVTLTCTRTVCTGG